MSEIIKFIVQKCLASHHYLIQCNSASDISLYNRGVWLTQFQMFAGCDPFSQIRSQISLKQRVQQFVSNSCGARLGLTVSARSSFLTKATIERYRNENLELTRDELILAQLRAFLSVSPHRNLQ